MFGTSAGVSGEPPPAPTTASRRRPCETRGNRPIGRGTVNVTHGLVRHYFGTRQAMLDEALEQAIDEDITALTLATAHPEAFADGAFTTEDERGDHPPAPSALARSRGGVA